ncbi:MAG: ThuA domain-containing protein [Candidatus Hydrogenedentes bacterium]|nr:ThuA domain-containing protein [Candidatus Hydrogenedentota bacterium]
MSTRIVVSSMMCLFAVSLVAGCASVGNAAEPGAKGKVLVLSKSAGFEHSVIKYNDQNVSHVDTVLKPLFEGMGMTYESTKDASKINAENLKNYKLVIFYTTGDLTQAGTDGQPPMGPNGVADLLAWLNNGGSVMGFHSSTDSFHTPENGEVTPFLKMLGGEFKTHGKQFAGTLKVVDPDHPAMARFPKDWQIQDEWYMFINLNQKDMHVLALLDPGEERSKQEMYNVPSYPMIWCSQYGNGRVYFNGMGHREDVWTNPDFIKVIEDAAKWTMGQGPAKNEPNYDKVVPTK